MSWERWREKGVEGKGGDVRSCVSGVGAQKQFVEDSLWFLDFYEMIFLKLWVVVCTWHQNVFQGEFFLVCVVHQLMSSCT